MIVSSEVASNNRPTAAAASTLPQVTPGGDRRQFLQQHRPHRRRRHLCHWRTVADGCQRAGNGANGGRGGGVYAGGTAALAGGAIHQNTSTRAVAASAAQTLSLEQR